MQFSDIIGQEEIKKRLINTVNSDQIAHAQLFTGIEGIGKLQLAIAYSQYINCANPSLTDSCGVCNSCQKISKLIHPDLHFVFPIHDSDKKKKSKKCNDFLSEWREFNFKYPYSNLNLWMGFIGSENSQGIIYSEESNEIIKKLSYKIAEAKYRVMIIWHPEKMNISCSNKILKILEEPYPNTLFIFVTNNYNQLLPTIVSRVQRINIKPLQSNEISAALCNREGITTERAKDIAKISQGSYFRAWETIGLADQNEELLSLFVEFMRSMYVTDIKKKKDISDKLAKLVREKQSNFLNYSIKLIQEYFMSHFQIPEIVHLRNNEIDFGKKFAQFINEKNIIRLIDEFTLADRHICQNVNSKMVFFDLCIKGTLLLKNK